MSRQGTIDVHAHFLPERYRKAYQQLGTPGPDGLAAWPDWTVGQALRTMDELGVELAILSVSSPGVHFGDDRSATVLARGVNEDGATLAAQHPDRFGFFASLPLPDVDSALDEIAYALDQLGADGVVLLSNYHGTYLFDPRFRPVFDELDRRGTVVFLHPTSPPCWEQTAFEQPRSLIEFPFETTRAITGLIVTGALDRYPRLRIIVPHGGGALPSLADRIHTLGQLTAERRGADAVDALAILRRLHYDLAGFPLDTQLPSLLGLVPPSQLLYGTDWPFTPQLQITESAHRIAHTHLLSNDDRHLIRRRNARQLFERFGQPHAPNNP
ncbi:amidohydrolase family protein [Streptomyces scopuliridis]|uniref:amidohydrolase family protein n=1 Tax=Streptomyces scopuliridis TaxID=452529 RepID=UPI0036CA2D83